MVTIHEIIDLMGQKSTSPEMAALFTSLALGKPPKSVNANQSTKGFTDKTNQLSFNFKFNITHEQFYPPVSPKKDDYNFDCYLSSVVLFSAGNGKKKLQDPKPASFWEGFVSPDASYETLMAFIGSDASNGKKVLRKSLNDIAEVVIWTENATNAISAMEIRLKESREIFSHYDFVEEFAIKTVKEAYTLLVKWLFDNQYLLLPAEVYQTALPADYAAIQDFTNKYLKNHIWDNQLIADGVLISFLYKISGNRNMTLPDGQSVNVYIKHLYIKSAGQWEAHQEIYDQRNFEELDNFERNISLNEQQRQHFLQTLTQTFELFKQIPKETF
ncbi:hypothetical protein CLV59_105320 [Chitinophaga dinghuensis]|uniref:Uncharacterized protein n=1 Tax=Chitinophaga dinghuensis TaxID=1539050 RepID=A0A327VXI9_9BACT|nr:hypothetical protein [Chitinophaga dinghuensis]RAJ80212.1 hypothetical protein CLV59_105320 [Chitinophaga dinghuensis]